MGEDEADTIERLDAECKAGMETIARERKRAEAAESRLSELSGDHIDIVFDGPPGHESGRFIEVENSEGHSINAGEWIERPDGKWALRISIRLSERTAPKGAKVSAEMIKYYRKLTAEFGPKCEPAPIQPFELNNLLDDLESSQARERAAVLAEREACAALLDEEADRLEKRAGEVGLSEDYMIACQRKAKTLRKLSAAIRARHPKGE